MAKPGDLLLPIAQQSVDDATKVRILLFNPSAKLYGHVPATGMNIAYANRDVVFEQDVTFNGIPLLTGGGIQFPATQVPSADANTLDDYEEGSFTPTMAFGGSSSGVTYTTQTGVYTKIGNLIYIRINIVLTSNGSGTGAATVLGVPFSALESANLVCASASNFSGLTRNVVGFLNGSTINLREFSATGVVNLDDVNVTNTAAFVLSGTYRT